MTELKGTGLERIPMVQQFIMPYLTEILYDRTFLCSFLLLRSETTLIISTNDRIQWQAIVFRIDPLLYVYFAVKVHTTLL